jgi:hypothetical protein
MILAYLTEISAACFHSCQETPSGTGGCQMTGMQFKH